MRRKRFSQLWVLHHPVAGFEPIIPLEPSFPFDGLSLFASTPDVGGETGLVQGAAHLSEVIALVQAQTLGMRWARRRARHRQAVHRGPHQMGQRRLQAFPADPVGGFPDHDHRCSDELIVNAPSPYGTRCVLIIVKLPKQPDAVLAMAPGDRQMLVPG